MQCHASLNTNTIASHRRGQQSSRRRRRRRLRTESEPLRLGSTYRPPGVAFHNLEQREWPQFVAIGRRQRVHLCILIGSLSHWFIDKRQLLSTHPIAHPLSPNHWAPNPRARPASTLGSLRLFRVDPLLLPCFSSEETEKPSTRRRSVRTPSGGVGPPYILGIGGMRDGGVRTYVRIANVIDMPIASGMRNAGEPANDVDADA